MIVRTHGHRGSRVPTIFSDEDELFSSQDSCSHAIMDDSCMRRKRKKAKVSKNCVDKVSFAVNGLRKGQPLRTTRASLLFLLSLYATSQRHHLLWSQGMAKTIIDAILGLSLNDSPTNLAAATLFYILTVEGQEDDHLLESPGSIRFLIKLLRPNVNIVREDKVPKFGSKLLALRENAGISNSTMERLDSSSVALFSRVQEILLNSKEEKITCLKDSGVERLELCPKWLALLIIEKACSSAISLDETSGAVAKASGNFKEKLREFGGLDAVFEITVNCLSDLELWMKDSFLSTKDLRNDKQLKSLKLLLKCLKIMENATFLSKDNQTHLLGLKRKSSPRPTPFSFVERVVTAIKILSDLCLSQNASVTSKDNRQRDPFSLRNYDSDSDLLIDQRENETVFSNSTGMYNDIERDSSVKSFNFSQTGQLLTSSQLEISLSVSETPRTSMNFNYSLNRRVSSSISGSSSVMSRCSDSETSMIQVEVLDDSRDPFAFDEDDIAPSKWDLLSGKQKRSHSKKYEVTNREFEDACQSQTNVSQQKLNNMNANCSSSYMGDEAGSSLPGDCLLTAVKVLMNLTNDNPVGCQQIAAYGGLETMSLLIADHFPSFSSSSLSSFQKNENTSDRGLTDHELDFLVAILGLLVNLVEKDGDNRSRLAAARVLIPTSDGLGLQDRRGVIQLLCFIFLANQVGGDEVEEDKYLLLDEEEVVLQGEKEAEKMIVGAYSALLLAFLSTESERVREAIADNLPHHNLSILVPVLDRFVEFHWTLNVISPETHKAVSEVIDSCRVT